MCVCVCVRERQNISCTYRGKIIVTYPHRDKCYVIALSLCYYNVIIMLIIYFDDTSITPKILYIE